MSIERAIEKWEQYSEKMLAGMPGLAFDASREACREMAGLADRFVTDLRVLQLEAVKAESASRPVTLSPASADVPNDNDIFLLACKLVDTSSEDRKTFWLPVLSQLCEAVRKQDAFVKGTSSPASAEQSCDGNSQVAGPEHVLAAERNQPPIQAHCSNPKCDYTFVLPGTTAGITWRCPKCYGSDWRCDVSFVTNGVSLPALGTCKWESNPHEYEETCNEWVPTASPASEGAARERQIENMIDEAKFLVEAVRDFEKHSDLSGDPVGGCSECLKLFDRLIAQANAIERFIVAYQPEKTHSITGSTGQTMLVSTPVMSTSAAPAPAASEGAARACPSCHSTKQGHRGSISGNPLHLAPRNETCYDPWHDAPAPAANTEGLRSTLERVKARMDKVGRDIFCPRQQWQEELEKALNAEIAGHPAEQPPQERQNGLLRYRFHEDSIEIASCLFNKGRLSDKTIDSVAAEIESWMRELSKEKCPQCEQLGWGQIQLASELNMAQARIKELETSAEQPPQGEREEFSCPDCNTVHPSPRCEAPQYVARAAAPQPQERALRKALTEARRVLVVACGEEAPYIKIALQRIDAALAVPKEAE